MTLHEAMVEVLREHGGGWMDREKIAAEIARRDLFRRPSDGAPPPSDQLRLRARKPEYQHLFECSDTACTRIRLRSGSAWASTGSGPMRAGDAGHTGRPADANPTPVRPEPGPAESGSSWYEELREQHRPERLRALLIAESPPDPGAGVPRFFYSPELTVDNLYRAVVEALYGDRDDVDASHKVAVLERIRTDGLWLIDAADRPVNKLAAAARARAIREGVPRLVQRCSELAPELGVIICHGKVYAAAEPALRAAGVRVLHTEPLPFPLGNWRARFVREFRRALTSGLSERRYARLKAALNGDQTGAWMTRQIEDLDGRTVLDLVLAGDERGIRRFAGA